MIRTLAHALELGLAILVIAVLCLITAFAPDPWADWSE